MTKNSNKMYRFIKKVSKKIVHYAKYPGELFRYNSPRIRAIYQSICKFLFFFSFKKRVDYAKSVDKIDGFNKKTGNYFTAELKDTELMKSAVNSASILISNYLSGADQEDQQKSYLHTIPFEKDFNLSHPIMKLATSDNLVDMATSYLNFLPILSEVRLWYSPNTSTKSVGSQLFHLDYADINQVKIFIPIDDIDLETGPLTFISSNNSQKICNDINYKLTNDEIRVPDDIINKYIGEEKKLKAVGSPGDIFCVDTSACLHFGSRGATKPRKILMIQYISPFSFSYPLFYKNNTTFSHLSSRSLDIKHQLLLGSA